MLKGLGRRFRAFVRDVWSFLRGEWFDLADDVWGFVRDDIVEEAPRAFMRAIKEAGNFNVGRQIDRAVGEISRNPEDAFAVFAGLTGLLATTSFPVGPGVALAPVVAAGFQTSLEFMLADERADRDLRLNIERAPERARAEWEAQKPLVPDQQRTQAEAQLAVADVLAAAQLAILRVTAPEQVAIQWEAQRPLLPEQAAAQWEAQKPLAEEQARVKAAADLAAQIAVRPGGIPTSAVADAFFRGIIDRPRFEELMARQGIPQDQLDEYIEALKFFPTPSDLVTWTGREVFEPESIRKYGLDDEFSSLDLELFAKVGVSEEIARNYWIAHWSHPSFTQISEMLRRDILFDPGQRYSVAPGSPAWAELRAREEEEAAAWLRLVEIPPYARAAMIQMLYEPFTRVDVRRMWDLGVVDDDDVRRTALDIGYNADQAEKYLLFVKVFNVLPDVVARYKNGHITEAQGLAELEEAGLSPAKARQLWDRKVKKPGAPERLAKEKDLTKAEIFKAVKKGRISVDEAAFLLEEMGYDPWETDVLIDINVGALEGSPDSFGELSKIVQSYRRSQGMDHKDVPPDVVALGRERSALLARLDELRAGAAGDAEITAVEAELRRIERRYNQRLVDAGLKPAPTEG